ncbi:MAG: hypothetical protein IJF03_01400 [Lachnospiraceae bacterium]|nr:hypothetical protein [Lachnospiraceae bacterium]
MKKIITIVLAVCCLCSLSACQKTEQNMSFSANTNEIMDGMHTLYAANTEGYAFGIDTRPSYGVDEDGIFELSSAKDTMYFHIESAGDSKRQLAVQIFIDYVQAPIIIDGTTYDTFYINADDKFSKEYAFRFAEEIDTTKNHKILAILTAYSNILMAKQDVQAVATSTDTSLCFDGILSFSPNNTLAEPLFNMNQPTELYEDNFNDGFLLNTATKNIRSIPDNTVTASPNETVTLKYHVGGGAAKESRDNSLILVNIANKQTSINEQAYYYIDTEPDKISYGDFSIQAPSEPGMYEITAWSVPNPFAPNITGCNINIPMAMRFTLEVK